MLIDETWYIFWSHISKPVTSRIDEYVACICMTANMAAPSHGDLFRETASGQFIVKTRNKGGTALSATFISLGMNTNKNVPTL
jgi:hypothetical protein